MSKKSHGKIKGGPLNDREIFSEVKEDHIAVYAGEAQIACITENSGTTIEDVIKMVKPKEA